MTKRLFFEPLPAGVIRRARAGLLTLMPGEIRVVAQLVQGKQAAEIGTALNTTEHTAQVHTQRILAKTGCGRLQLIRILCLELADDYDLFEHLEARAGQFNQVMSDSRRGKSSRQREGGASKRGS